LALVISGEYACVIKIEEDEYEKKVEENEEENGG
jgi:hypothetical protein